MGKGTRGTRGRVIVALLGGVAGWMLHGQQTPDAPPTAQQIIAAASPPTIIQQPLKQQKAQTPAPQPVPQVAPQKPIADRQTIIQQIIKQSLASYRGNCPCPYNTDRAARSLGRASWMTRRN